jgi:radical SAM superfamily enzyme YgiQ (UPF0313 family)
MKALLMFPPNIDVIEPFKSKQQKPEPLVWGFPLGIGCIAAVLEQNGFEVEILDACSENLSIETIKGRIERSASDAVGIGMLTSTSKTAVAIAHAVKEIDPHIPVFTGGPHVTFDYRNLLQNHPFDYVVLGEGEYTTLELMQALREGRQAEDIKGLAFSNGQQITVTPPRPLITDLDALPYPARHLVDYESYIEYTKYAATPSAAEVMGSRGCSHRCAFCSSSHLFGRWRGRSPQNIMDELEFLRTRYPKVKSFSFMDDNFTFNRNRTFEICYMLIERGLNRYPWECLARVDQVDSEMLDLMSEAGCRRIKFGIESGSPEILKNIRKKISLDTARESIELTRKAGIEAIAYFMLGNPGETMETIEMSVSVAKGLRSTNTLWFIAQIYPGTEFAQLQPVDNWVEYIYQPEVEKPSMFLHPCVPVFLPDGFTRESLKQIATKLTRRFILYHAPQNILKWPRKFIRSPWPVARYVYKVFR